MREGLEFDHRLARLPAALKYLASGWSIIPVTLVDGKKPPPKRFEWKKYQERLPTPEELRIWWGKWPDAGIAVICGSVSGVYVLDVDPKNGGKLEGKSLPNGPVSRTLNAGHHHFFKSDVPLPKRQGILHGMDFIGEGSYAVLPPSWGQYEWLQEPIGGLPNLPQWVMDLVFNGAHHPPKRKNGKKEWTSHPRPLVEDQVRFLPELNAECIRSKLSWVAIMWTELRMLDQQLTKGRGFIPGNEGCNYLFDRGFSERRVLEALQAGRGIFWKFIWRGPCLTIQLHGLRRVCEALGVEIKNTPGYGHPHWQYVPLADFQGDKRLAHFRAAACYEAKDTSNRVSKISRCSIQDRSGVPSRTQVRDADKLGLLLPTKKKNGRRKCGKSTYLPNKQEEGPRFYQEASILRGAACLGPVGRLATVKQAVEGSRLKTPGRVGDPAGSPTVTAFTRPWKYFWTDRQYQQAIRRAQKGILGALEVDCNPEVEMPGSERRKYRVRHEVSLWREAK